MDIQARLKHASKVVGHSSRAEQAGGRGSDRVAGSRVCPVQQAGGRGSDRVASSRVHPVKQAGGYVDPVADHNVGLVEQARGRGSDRVAGRRVNFAEQVGGCGSDPMASNRVGFTEQAGGRGSNPVAGRRVHFAEQVTSTERKEHIIHMQYYNRCHGCVSSSNVWPGQLKNTSFSLLHMHSSAKLTPKEQCFRYHVVISRTVS